MTKKDTDWNKRVTNEWWETPTEETKWSERTKSDWWETQKQDSKGGSACWNTRKWEEQDWWKMKRKTDWSEQDERKEDGRKGRMSIEHQRFPRKSSTKENEERDHRSGNFAVGDFQNRK